MNHTCVASPSVDTGCSSNNNSEIVSHATPEIDSTPGMVGPSGPYELSVTVDREVAQSPHFLELEQAVDNQVVDVQGRAGRYLKKEISIKINKKFDNY